MDDRGLAPSQKNLIDKLIRQLNTLTGQSTDEIWLLLREHLGLAKTMSLTLHHFSAAEFFLQQKIQYAQQGGSQNLLEKIMAQLSQGNNKEKIMAFMRSTFGHTALSLLNENELKQVLAQLPSALSGDKNASTSSKESTTASALGNTSSLTPTNFATIPMPQAQLKVINQLIYNLSQLLNIPIATIKEQLHKLLNHPVESPLLNQHFKMASEFLQTRILVAQDEYHPLKNLLNLIQPLSKNEQQFIQQYALANFNLSMTGILTINQADKIVIELFTKRATGKAAWQVEGNITPIFSGMLPEIKKLMEKPSVISGVFAFVLFFIFLALIFSV